MTLMTLYLDKEENKKVTEAAAKKGIGKMDMIKHMIRLYSALP